MSPVTLLEGVFYSQNFNTFYEVKAVKDSLR
jgi:hypothetical protein